MKRTSLPLWRVWLLAALVLPTAGFADVVPGRSPFEADPPTLPAIEIEAWAEHDDVRLPANEATFRVSARQVRQGPQLLSYRWVQLSGPPTGEVIFSPNDSVDADQTTATFSNRVAGPYTIRVIVSDGFHEAISELEFTLGAGEPSRRASSRHRSSGVHSVEHAASGKTQRYRVERSKGRAVVTRADRVIVRFDVDLPPEDAPVSLESRLRTLSVQTRATLETLGATLTKVWCDGRLGLVTIDSPEKIAPALEALQATPEIRYAVLDHTVSLNEFVPNDAQFGAQWPLGNTADVDIDATLAWDQTTGSSNATVAVMDTGVDYTHPDLYLAIALNNSEIPSSLSGLIVDSNANGLVDFYDLNSLDAGGSLVVDGNGAPINDALVADADGNGYIDAGDLQFPPWSDGIDDDGNGYVDDLTGWDYVVGDNDPIDTHGHGTHVAGIIAARGNNEIGIAGVDWRVQIIPERFQSGSGGNITELIQAVDHAVLLGADVINASWGTTVDNLALKDTIAWAGENGAVFVAAAGNQSNDIDVSSNAYYPAAYTDLPNLISVASIDPSGFLSSFSNFGPTAVDIAAPGASVLSTGVGGGYVLWSGTSMAAPHVAGVASLLAGLFPDATPEWLVTRILSTAKPRAELVGQVATGGMLDAFSAVNTTNDAGPRVLSASPIGDVLTATDRVVLTFDRAIDVATFSIADVDVAGPDGPVLPTDVVSLSDSVFEVVFPLQTALGSYRLDVGPEIEDSLGFVMDQDRDGTIGEAIDDRFGVMFRRLPPPSTSIVDDGDPGYNATGGWVTYAGVGLGGDFAYKAVGSGTETATWTFGNLAPGRYRVSTTWQAYSNRAVDAPYTVRAGATELGTVMVDQRLTPSDFFEEQWWQDLGGPYTLVGDTLVIELSDLAGPSGSYLIADAVRIERLEDLPPGPEIAVLVEGAPVLDGTGSVNFGTTGVDVPSVRTVTVQSIGTTDLILGSITVPPGFTLISGFSSSTLAPGQEATFVVQFDATAVGVFTETVTFDSNDADENPFDFTVSATVSDAGVSPVQTIDDGDTGFSAIGSWSSYSGAGLQSDFSYKVVGSGADTATWTFGSLVPGRYRVSITWQAHSNRATDAPFMVLDGPAQLGVTLVDQRQTPTDFFDEEWWQDLGALHTITGNTLVVRLNDLAGPGGSKVIADAVRIERVADLPSGPEVAVLVNGEAIPDDTGSVDFGTTETGVPVSRTVTVKNVGTTDLALDAITVPAGFTLVSGFATTTVTPDAQTSFVVQLDAASAGVSAGTVSFGTNDSDENPYDFIATGLVSDSSGSQIWILDDGDAGFTTAGGWTAYAGAGLLDDLEYKLVGDGAATATWTFTGLTPGQYNVSVTWLAYSNRPGDAPYTVLDGATELVTLPLDQRQAPADFFEDVWWDDLGGPHTITGDTLVVRLSDFASPSGSYVIADGVRVERVGDSPSAPEIAVFVDGGAVTDGTGTVDFGTTLVGAPVSRTVTARNVGTTDLTLGTISLSGGFSLVSDFATTTLTPGAETSFVMQLDAALAGASAGTVSFGTNDADENPFDFNVTGTVTDAGGPQIWIVDDGDPGYVAVGGWSTYNGAGSDGDFSYKAIGNGAATATWTFTGLTPGQYYVSATWQAYSNRATDAGFTVLDGATELGTVQVNQRLAPADFFDQQWWQDLGGLYTLTGDTLVVQLSDLAGPSGTYVIADGIRVERVGDVPSGPEISVFVDGSAVTDGTGTVDFGTTLAGAPVSRAVTARNVGATDLTLGTIAVSGGFSLVSGFATTTLAPGAETSFVVQLDADLAGTSAGTVSFGTNDVDENPFDFNVTGTVTDAGGPQIWIVDDGDAGYVAVGGWSTYNGTGLDGDFSYKAIGNGAATATWTFTGLTPGQYYVSATWQAYSNRATDAGFTVLDGATELGTVQVNQRLAPADFFDQQWWQDLSGLYTLTGDTLVVQLSDLAGPSGSYVIADGIRVERVGDVPSGPEISVFVDGSAVTDGTGTVDFGTVLMGVPVSLAVTARNVGTTDLTLGTIAVSGGFSLVSGFATTTLAPGAETSFVVQLDADLAGTSAGTVSFGTNDADENPFDFNVTGTVTDAGGPQIWIVDDGDGGYVAVGGWSTYNGAGSDGDFSYKAIGNGAATATWTFTGLTPGQYNVSATWQAFSNRATDVGYTILDGATELGTVQVNQRLAPADFFDQEWWQDLGGSSYTLTGDTLVVQLNDLAGPSGSYVIADGIRVERVGGLP